MGIDAKENISSRSGRQSGDTWPQPNTNVGNINPANTGNDDQSRTWIYKPAVDLAIGCAAWSAPLMLLLYFTADYGMTLSIAFYGLALLFNFPHYTATIYRAYRTREDFSRYRIFTIHLTLLIALAGAIVHWAACLIPWLFTIYITWSPWHYSGQNFGLTLMFARRARVNPTRVERTALYVSFLASYALVFISIHTGASPDPYVRSLGLPVEFGDTARAVLAGVFAVTGPWALYRLGRRGGWRTIVAPVTLFATQFIWFVMPFVLHLAYKVEIPQTRYSTGILAVMHSAQYLWITSYYARREALAAGAEPWRARSYFAVLIVGGVALFLPGPWIISYVFHYDFTSTMLICTSIVNIHHFLLDGVIWKLREGRIASFLISSPAVVRSSVWGVAAWISGSRRPARAFRFGAAGVLILLALADQARYFLSADAGNLTNLSRAQRLNPYDGPVHTSVARIEDGDGDVDRAVEDYRKALRLNPRNDEAMARLARLLIENQRYQEAYDEYKMMAPYLRSDLDSLINFGILADRLGHRDEAIESWKQALVIDPDAGNAHLYLGDALYSDGKRLEAVPHYERYLALLTSTQESRLEPQDVVTIALKLGDVYTATSDFERALIYYRKAADIAQRTKVKGLESLALEHAGNLYVEARQPAQAADLFRKALKLDADGRDDKAAGLDWLAYAQFLSGAGQPRPLVLACTLKAQGLLASASPEELDVVKRYREAVESGMTGAEVDRVHQGLDSLVDQSLGVKF